MDADEAPEHEDPDDKDEDQKISYFKDIGFFSAGTVGCAVFSAARVKRRLRFSILFAGVFLQSAPFLSSRPILPSKSAQYFNKRSGSD